MTIKRIETGIPGMDELLYGGIPMRNIVLLSGGPGTGKSIFSQQYIYYGLKKGEPGIYITLEEHPVAVRENMLNFGWDTRPYEEQGMFAIIDGFTGGIGRAAERERFVVVDPTDVRTLIDVIKEAIHWIQDNTGKTPVRGVIDSVTALYLTKPSIARNIVLQLKKVFSGYGITGFFVSQVSVTERGFGGPGVEHAVDGIIRLDLDEINGELKRSLIIWKMRGTKHDMRRHEFEITDKGIIVYPDKVIRRRKIVVIRS
ncbi:MAG TPA: KaiC domain-containing protein [Candidatus Nanopusillus sp.]|nr:KaiC domain-containing protein [Candidatus Nanopusillus sp.]